jgi:hypothetical protein
MGKRKGTRKSLKKPKMYDDLREKGYSKRKAAKISNAAANGTLNHRHKAVKG